MKTSTTQSFNLSHSFINAERFFRTAYSQVPQIVEISGTKKPEEAVNTPVIICDGSKVFIYGFTKKEHAFSNSVSKTLLSFTTNATLSLELYLKCVYFLDNHKAFQGNNLKEIFNGLGVFSRNKIEAWFDALIEINPFYKTIEEDMTAIEKKPFSWSIEDILERNFMSNNKWKTSFAGIPGFFGAFLELRSTLWRRILELEPELQSRL